MKKLYIAAFVFMFACMMVPRTAQSQVLISILFGEQLNSGQMEFGLITGANVSTMTGIDDAKILPTFKLGLFFDYKITENWIGSFEANVKNTVGYTNINPDESLFPIQDSILNGSNTTVRSFNSLQCPIFISYRFKNRLSIGAGGYLAYQHGTRDYIDYTFGNTDLTIEQSFTEFVNWLDAGLVGAVSYHFKRREETNYPGISLRFKTSYGLTNAFKESAGFEAHHLWFSFDVAIPIIMSVF